MRTTLRWDCPRLAAVALATLALLAAAGWTDGSAASARSRTRTARVVRNLHAFVKLYGYVRWFHPSDEASGVDWDRFAVVGAGRVRGAADDAALRKALADLFTPIAPTLQLYGRGETPRDVATFFVGAPADAPVVVWQHLGAGSGEPNSIYRSTRLNHGGPADTARGTFGTIIQSVSAVPLRGKTVRLHSVLRARVTVGQGSGSMWLRVDRPNGQVGLFDNMSDRPATRDEWTEAEIVGTVDPDGEQVYFGAFLQGRGAIDIDDFRLELKREDGGWESVPITNAGFEGGDSEELLGWSPPAMGYRARVVAEAPREGVRCLRISHDVGSGLPAGALFEKAPALGESFDRVLVDGLHCRLPLALPSIAAHTFPAADSVRLAALQQEVHAVDAAALSAEDEGTRIAGIAHLWNVTGHFWPYFDVVHPDWEQALDDALARMLRDCTSEDHGNTLRAMLAPLDDGHVGVTPTERPVRAYVRAFFGWVEGRVVVQDSHDSLLQPGDVVRSIDGRDARKVVDDLVALRSGTERFRRRQAMALFGRGAPGTRARLALERDGRRIRVEVPRDTSRLWPRFRMDPVAQVEDSLWYVDLGRARMSQIDSLMTELVKARGVLFDLRGYPNTTHAVLLHLASEPLQSAIWRVPRIVRPDREGLDDWDTSGRWTLAPRPPRLPGRIAFLIGPGSISYCESVLGIVEHYRLAELVGEPTAGANGNVNVFTLAGGFTARWTGMRVLKHDGSEHHRVGILPTIPAHPTIAGIRAGRDEVLERGLETVRGRAAARGSGGKP